MEVREIDGVKVIADSEELLTFKCAGRRPYYRMRGKPVTDLQASEIIGKINNLINFSNYSPPGHGWIHTDGTVGINSITFKLPNAEEFIEEWSDFIKMFPYLDLVIAITWWDEISPTEHDIQDEWFDIENSFGIFDDFEKEDYDDEFYDAIEIGIYVHDNTVELMSPERTREKYREYVELYEDENRDKYLYDYYEDKNEYTWKEKRRQEKNKITVRTKEELDAVDTEFDGIIQIEFGGDHNLAEVRKNYKAEIHVDGEYFIGVWGKNEVVAHDNSYVAVHDEARVEAYDKVWVYADGGAFADASGQVYIQARDNSVAVMRGNGSVFARENAKIRAYGSTTIKAYGNVNIRAFDECVIDCRSECTVTAGGRCVVKARDKCKVTAMYRCLVFAGDECIVEAEGDSVIEAKGAVTVTAKKRSTINAGGSACVFDRQQGGEIFTTGWAHVNHIPKTVTEFCECNGLWYNENKVRFYIPAQIRDGIYEDNNYSPKVTFEVGKTTALKDYQADYTLPYTLSARTLKDALAECIPTNKYRWHDYDVVLEIEAELKDVELCKYSDEDVSVKAARVIRVVPFSECGEYAARIEEASQERIKSFKFGYELIDGKWHML